MEHVEIREVTPCTGAVEPSYESHFCALSEQYAARGLVKAVQDSAAEQQMREAQTRELSPESYRLSEVGEAVMCARYRQGKDHMSVLDLLRYFSEVRDEHIETCDLEENNGIDLCTGSNVKQVAAITEKAVAPVSRLRELPRTAKVKISQALPVWFNSAQPDTSDDHRQFPLSAIAALLAVAASLLLIVASSVMVRLAESDVSRLKTQISSTTTAARDLESDLEVRNDLLQIRTIATEEYGMIDENYVKMDYISLRAEDSVESFEEEREESVGLAALLSAIGLR